MRKSFYLILTIFLLCCGTISAQKRHALRTGAGVNLHPSYYNKGGYYSVGPALYMDYQYVISKFFDLNVNMTYFTNQYSPKFELMNYSPSVRVMFTPLPKYFRYFQFGVGAAYSYARYIYGSDELTNFSTKDWHSWGIDVPIRMYAIDNDRFQLFFDYTLSYRYYRDETVSYFGWDTSRAGVCFGVKF